MQSPGMSSTAGGAGANQSFEAARRQLDGALAELNGAVDEWNQSVTEEKAYGAVLSSAVASYKDYIQRANQDVEAKLSTFMRHLDKHDKQSLELSQMKAKFQRELDAERAAFEETRAQYEAQCAEMNARHARELERVRKESGSGSAQLEAELASVRAELRELRAQSSQCFAEREHQSSTIASLRAQAHAANSQSESLSKALQRVKQRLVEAEAKAKEEATGRIKFMEQWQGEMEQMRLEAQQRHHTADAAQKEVDGCRQRIASLERQLKDAEARVSAAEAASDDFRVSLEKANARLKDKFVSTRESYSDTMRELEEVKAEARAAEKRIILLTRNNDTKDARIEQLERHLDVSNQAAAKHKEDWMAEVKTRLLLEDRLKAESLRAAESKVSLEKANSRLKEKLAQLRQQVEEAVARAEAAEQATEKDLSDTRSQAVELRQQLEDVRHKRDDWKARATEWQQRYDQVTQAHEALHTSHSEAQLALATVKVEVESLKAKVTSGEVTVADVKKQLAAKTSELHTQAALVRRTEQAHESLQTELDALRERCRDVEEQVKAELRAKAALEVANTKLEGQVELLRRSDQPARDQREELAAVLARRKEAEAQASAESKAADALRQRVDSLTQQLAQAQDECIAAKEDCAQWRQRLQSQSEQFEREGRVNKVLIERQDDAEKTSAQLRADLNQVRDDLERSHMAARAAAKKHDEELQRVGKEHASALSEARAQAEQWSRKAQALSADAARLRAQLASEASGAEDLSARVKAYGSTAEKTMADKVSLELQLIEAREQLRHQRRQSLGTEGELDQARQRVTDLEAELEDHNAELQRAVPVEMVQMWARILAQLCNGEYDGIDELSGDGHSDVDSISQGDGSVVLNDATSGNDDDDDAIVLSEDGSEDASRSLDSNSSRSGDEGDDDDSPHQPGDEEADVDNVVSSGSSQSGDVREVIMRFMNVLRNLRTALQSMQFNHESALSSLREKLEARVHELQRDKRALLVEVAQLKEQMDSTAAPDSCPSCQTMRLQMEEMADDMGDMEVRLGVALQKQAELQVQLQSGDPLAKVPPLIGTPTEFVRRRRRVLSVVEEEEEDDSDFVAASAVEDDDAEYGVDDSVSYTAESQRQAHLFEPERNQVITGPRRRSDASSQGQKRGRGSEEEGDSSSDSGEEPEADDNNVVAGSTSVEALEDPLVRTSASQPAPAKRRRRPRLEYSAAPASQPLPGSAMSHRRHGRGIVSPLPSPSKAAKTASPSANTEGYQLRSHDQSEADSTPEAATPEAGSPVLTTRRGRRAARGKQQQATRRSTRATRSTTRD